MAAKRGTTYLQGNLVVEGMVWASGTTLFSTAATNLDSTAGQIRASVSFAAAGLSSAGTIVSGTTIKAGTSMQANTGYAFANSAIKQFAFGTYIGTGGATAAITSTSLTTIHGVTLWRQKSAYSSATTGNVITGPCVAPGTPGSFYPIMFKHTGAPGPVLNTVAGTFRYLAVGAKTLT